MNKQELIDELAKYVKSYENAMDEHGQGRYGAYEVSLKLVKRLNESKITDEQAWNKVAEAYPESAQSLRNTLDNAVFGKTGEPQKHVMPKFVAEWISKCRELNWILPDLLAPEAFESNFARDTEEWLRQDKQNYDILARAWIDGYEVEKEPLYTVTINLDRKYHLVVDEGDGNDEIITTLTTTDGVFGYRYFLTEKEIKSADENLWKIAVPVEEVAEI